MANNQIKIGVGFSIDKSGLTELQSILKTITTESQFSSVSEELKQAGAAANTLSDILEKSFNKDLGVMNVNKFNAELSKSNLNIRQAKIELEKAGSTGSRAYNLLTNAILGTNVQLKESNKLLDSMATSMANTVKWGITSSIFNNISGSIQKAYGYAKNLDSSLTDIRIVTDKSAESMREFAKQANDAAKGLGASTLDYTEASLIYYQQGLSDEEAAARAETTIKAANVTGQTGQEVSEQLTAVWNGYKVTAEEAELYVDKLAAVAADTSADLEELSVGMSKVASAANLMGVDIDQLNAQLATIVSVTRQAPESVGTALKTIYARMGDIEAGLDSETTLGAYTQAMSEMGFNVLDMNGNLRDMGEVIEEIGGKWSTMSREQQISLSQTIAGTRQYNNLLALFDNWDMYTDALQTSADAAGTLQKQQDIYMESTAAHLKELKASMEGIYDNIFEPSELNVMIDGLTNLAEVSENFIGSFGGGLKSIAGISTIVANIFNKQISAGLVKAIENQKKYNQNVAILEKKAELLKENQIQSGQSASPMGQAISANTETQLKYAREIQQVRAGISSEEYNILTSMQQQMGQLEQEAVLIEQTALKRAEGLTLKKEENVLEKISLDNAELVAAHYEEMAIEKQINLELTQENAKAISKELNSVIAIENESEEMNAILSNVISIRDRLSNEVGEQLKNEVNILEQLENEEDKAKFLLENKEKILKVLKQIELEEKKNVDRTKQQAKNAQDVANAKEQAEDIRAQEGQIANEFDDAMDTAQRSVDISQKVVTVTSSLSSIAMTWMTINGLMETWSDENATLGDKLTQTFMSLGMIVPGLISSFGQLNEALGFESTLFDVLNTKWKAHKALKELDAASTAKVTMAQHAENLALENFAIKKGISINAIKAEDRARIRELTLKANNITLTEAETAALNKATAAQTARNASILANPYILIGAAIVTGIAAIAIAYDAIHVSAEEASKALEESNKALEEQRKITQELNTELETTSSRIDELLNKGSLSLVEKEELARLKAVEKSLEVQLKSAKELEKIQRQDTIDDIVQANEAGSFQIDGEEFASSMLTDNITKMETERAIIVNSMRQSGDPNSEAYKTNQAELIRLDAEIAKAKEELKHPYTQEAIEKSFTQAMENLPTLYEKENEETLSEDELKAKTKLEDNVLKYFEYNNSLLDTLGAGISAAEMDKKTVEEIISKSQDLLLNAETHEIDETLLRQIIGDDEEFAALESYLQALGISAYDFIEQISYGDTSLDKIWETVEENSISMSQQLNNSVNSVKANLATLFSEEDISDEEQLAYLEDLESKYTDLAAIRDRTSQRYLETLRLVQEEEEKSLKIERQKDKTKAIEEATKALEEYHDFVGKAELKLAKETYESGNYLSGPSKEDKEKIQVEASLAADDLIAQIEEVFEQDYQLELSITNDIITDVDNIVGAAENAAQAVEMIGEGFKVAADNSQALFDIFPELAHNAEVLADGTIQLDNEVVKTVLGNNAIEIDSDKEVVAQAIDNRIAELEADRAATQKQLEQVRAGVLEESELQSILDDMATDSTDYQTQLSGALAEDEVANSAASAEAVIDHWAKKQEAARLYGEMVAAATGENPESVSEVEQIVQSNLVKKIEISNKSSEVESIETEAERKARIQKAVEDALQNKIDSDTEMIADLLTSKSKLFAGIDGIEDAAKGSGSDRDKKELKDQGEEIDRYWELNKAIEMVTEALSDLDKQQENLYGRELIESLKQENELLEEQAAAYEALAEEQRKEAYELQGILQAYGVVFDAQGGVANYLAASQTALDSYNQAVIQYNAGIIDEATFAAAERAYETFKALMERYEALYYEEWQETQNQLDDIHRQQLENNLKAWETELELKLDTAEAERDWNDFLAEINEDFKSHYRDISAEIETLLKNAGTYVADDGTIEADIQAMRDIMAEIDKMKNGGESDMFSSISEAQEKLKELIEQMQDDATALYDLYKSVWEAFMEGIDQSAEKFEDLIEQFERIDGELEYQGQLIELLYGEEAYGMLDKLYKAQEKNTLAQVDSLKQQKDMWYELWQNAEEGSEEQAKYYELWTQAQDDLNSKVIEYIELLQTDYLNTVDDILSKLDKDLTGGMGMEKLKEQWEEAKEEAEKYLNETEEVYAIQSLYNKYSESISNASSLKSQQKLQALREEELQMLREKDKLTQYDIDRAEAKYQIALKEMALEDARNAKDSMKLTRGTDGNWSYQYVADEDDIANKEQELLDAQNNLYEIDMEEQMNKIDEYIEKLSEFQEEKEELYRQLYATTDEIERQRILDDIARLEEEYYPQLEELAVGFEEVNQNLAASSAGVMLTALTQNKDNFASLTEEQRLLMEGLIASGVEDYADLESKVKLNYDGIGLKAEEALSSISTSWGTGAQALIDAWNADDGESVKAQMEEAHKAIMEAADEYQRKIEEVAEVVEEDWSEDGITGAIGEAEEATEDLEDATGDLVDETVDLLDEYADALEEVEEMWEEVKDAIEDATAAAREYMSLTGNGSSSGNEGPGYNPITPPNTPGTGGGSGNGGGSGSGSKNYTYTVGFVKGEETWHKFGLDWSGVEFEKQANDYENEGSYIKNEVTGKVKAITTKSAFDTGGYTGDWAGGEGKMAILHSKELVLNAADTKNILKVVDTVRDLSNLSSSIEDVIMRNISSMLAKMMNIGTTNANYTTNTTNNEQKTENIFHINAEFPNANDVNDIKEALLSLPNLASQYLMENKK